MIPEIVNLDVAPVWVKLWHVPLELFSQQGLGYLASALGKPLYTDRSTALKLQLEFAKVCIEVEANFSMPSSITVDLGYGNYVEVGVELDWAPPHCVACGIFGHSSDRCKKHCVPATDVVVVSEPLAPVEIEEVLIVGNEIRDLSTIDSQVEAVVDCEDQSDLSSRPERIAAGGVAHLMEQLKPKDKGALVRKENEIRGELSGLEKTEEQFYRQKSRVQYVKEGDQNFAYFFRKDGNVVSVSDAFLKKVLGYELSSSARDSLIVSVNQ
ncbi:hypothetical protein V6N13_070194 [Hibiscus sabdariffa]